VGSLPSALACILIDSAVLGFVGFVYHVLFFTGKQPEVSHVNPLELCVAVLMTLFIVSAAALTTTKFKAVCDSISDSPQCATDCAAKFECIADVIDGYTDIHKRLTATQDSLWVATVLWFGVGGFCVKILIDSKAAGGKDKAYGV
jgi:hypothetical protein